MRRQNSAKALRPDALPLKDEGLSEGFDVDKTLAQQQIAQILAKDAGCSLYNLAVLEGYPAFTTSTVQRKHTRFATETDDLENVPQAQVFEISDKTHGNPDVID
jgi:hypothetical protein